MSFKRLPGYYAILPPKIRYNRKLSANAKLLWAELSAIQSHNNEVYASNEYLGYLMDLKIRQVQYLLKELKDSKLITIKQKRLSRIIIINIAEFGLRDGKDKLTDNWLEDFYKQAKEYLENQ